MRWLHYLRFSFYCFTLVLFSCHSQEVKKQFKDTSIARVATNHVTEAIVIIDTVASVYRPYLTDTTTLLVYTKGFMGANNAGIKIVFDSLVRQADKKEYASLVLERQKAERLNSELYAYLSFKTLKQKLAENLKRFSGFNTQKSRFVTIADIRQFFNSLDTAFKKSPEGKKIEKEIKEHELNALKNIGLDFSEFFSEKLITLQDGITTFKEVLNPKSDYTLVMFGASWCSPCRYGERLLMSWYPAFDSNKLKVIGISLDKDKRQWMAAHYADNIGWKSYLAFKEFQNPVVKKFSIDYYGLPRIFLLDSTNKILADDWDITKIVQKIPFVSYSDSVFK